MFSSLYSVRQKICRQNAFQIYKKGDYTMAYGDTIGSTREYTSTLSLNEIREIASVLDYSSNIMELSAEAMIAIISEAVRRWLPTAALLCSISYFTANVILDHLQNRGYTAIGVKYTETFNFLYGDPTTLPRWQVTKIEYLQLQ